MTTEGESLAVKNKRQLQHLKEEVRGQLSSVGTRIKVFRSIITNQQKNFCRLCGQTSRYRDVMVLMRHPALLDELCHAIAEHARAEIPVAVDAIAGLEARGFLFGPQIAVALNVPFIPIRKKGKLPGKTITQSYSKEYGIDVMEVQEDAIQPGSKVLVVDDLLATGGTLNAAIALIEKAGGEVAEAFTLIELAYLSPRKALPQHIPIYALISLDH
uniref:Adenine phosphoribosyltransferase n=2 Tax=Ascaris TaxID=6251 RepID=A0A9J2PW58_ASCLU